MKKILFPTDFSEAADNAFVHALELAKKVDAELILLHTFELPIVDNQYFPENYQRLFDSVELSKFEAFKHQVEKLRSIAATLKREDIKMSHRLMMGDLVQSIKTTIKEDGIDFVVMGTTGANGWKETFLGTHTGEVATAIEVPVLSVPLVAKYDKVETIGFTTRYRQKDKAALLEVLFIAKKMKANVKCLYVKNNNSDVSEITVEVWEREFSHEPVQFFVIPDDDVSTTIMDFIANQGIDILAMTTYKSNFFVELFTTHFTEKMTYHSTIPVLVMHE